MVEKVRPAGLVTAGRGKTKRPLALAAPLPNSQNQTSVQASPLRAAIIGSDECRAEGFSALAASPVLSLCRKLIAAGHDPDQPMQVWRNGTLCLRVRSIGLAAGLEVNTKGTGFIRHRAVRAGVRTACLGKTIGRRVSHHGGPKTKFSKSWRRFSGRRGNDRARAAPQPATERKFHL
jgi:hypothetical protein